MNKEITFTCNETEFGPAWRNMMNLEIKYLDEWKQYLYQFMEEMKTKYHLDLAEKVYSITEELTEKQNELRAWTERDN